MKSAEIVARINRARTGKIPAGYFTVRQWMAKWDLSRCQTHRILQDAVAAGICDRLPFRIQCDSTFRPVPHYRMKA